MRLLVQGSALALPLADESVQTCVTSPPYWGLRQYAGEQGAAPLGLEATPELYVEHMVEVFREVRRVLRDDGTLWLNLGDSYAAARSYQVTDTKWRDVGNTRGSVVPMGLKPKDLVGIPWRVAFALQADGWWLRSDIIWAKPNPMPESVTDRPTKSHEYLFLLTKSPRYYYDADAIREPVSPNWKRGAGAPMPELGAHVLTDGRQGHQAQRVYDEAKGANARSVWNIATRPYAGAHFAAFPPELPRRCILAGSAAQACAECGAPWARVVERDLIETEEWGPARKDAHVLVQGSQSMARDGKGRAGSSVVSTTGWRTTCAHADGSSSSIVLDPFSGTGTTGAEAIKLGRRYVGIDISREYLVEHAQRRVNDLQHEMGL